MRISANTVIFRRMQRLASLYQVGIEIFEDRDRDHFSFNPMLNLIKIPSKVSSSRFAISAFFHELGHLLDFRDGKFRSIYTGQRFSKKGKLPYLKNVFNLERSADLRGRALFREHFPGQRYLIMCPSKYKMVLVNKYHKQVEFNKLLKNQRRRLRRIESRLKRLMREEPV